MSIRKIFEEELALLKNELVEMCRLTEQMIESAITALVNRDRELGKSIGQMDKRVDEYEMDIEKRCMRILLKQQPVAKDFREVSTALKMITDIERFGDQASDIGDLVYTMPGEKYIKKLTHITAMGNLAVKMVRESVNSFINNNESLADEVIKLDDEGMQEVYEGAFEENYETKIFENGKDFFDVFNIKKPDLVILDIMLPIMDGFTILTKIREIDEKIPVICVSAKSDEISFVKGLNKGADDYMAKPFSVLELLARVKTNLRRAKLYITNADGFSIDNNVYKAFYSDKDLGLTIKEFKLLKLLIGKAGVTVEREEMFLEVWGEDYMGETRTLDIHIASLREKIREAGGKDCIVTVRGIGYRFENK